LRSAVSRAAGSTSTGGRPASQRALGQLHHVADRGLNHHWRGIQLLAARESEQPAGELGAAAGRAQGSLHALHRGLVPGHLTLKQIKIAHHHAEKIVEVVGDAAGQLAQRLHLVALRQLALQVTRVRHVEDVGKKAKSTVHDDHLNGKDDLAPLARLGAETGFKVANASLLPDRGEHVCLVLELSPHSQLLDSAPHHLA
jgi:hypothetical protein